MAYDINDFLYHNDINKLVNAHKGDGVLTGCGVTIGTGLQINVAAGAVIINGTKVTVGAATPTVSTPDSSNPRKDIVTVNSGGTVSITAGTPLAELPTGNSGRQTHQPDPASIPANSVILGGIWVGAGVSEITSPDIEDARVFIVYVDGVTLTVTNGEISVVDGAHSHTAVQISDFDTEVGNHTDVTANTTHRSSNGTDHSNVVLNDTHRSGTGSDHSDVADNTTHSTGTGADHADVASNTTHRNIVTGNPHVVTKTEVSLGNVTDDAQLKRAANDISTFSEKVAPASADILLIEDSADAGNKKKVQITNLPAGAPPAHNDTTAKQGGTPTEYYHLTSAQHTDLTDAGDSALHYHSTDRARANHTGTQTASTILDFDTEVGNHTDVAANTVHRSSDGKDHSDVVLNNTHRAGDGSDHSDVDDNTLRFTHAKEPMGLKDITETTISFVNGTLTFTIAKTGADFTVYVQGNKFVKTSNENVVITDTEGMWFIYYNASGVLTASQTPWDFAAHAPVAYIYWDAVNNLGELSEERHGISMDWATHEWAHNTIGARIESGFGIDWTEGDGSLDAHAQVDLSDGLFHDEDLEITVTDGSPQDISPIAQLPVWYRDGSGGPLRKSTADNFPILNTGTGRAAYNLDTAGTWSQAEVTDNAFVAYWIIATNSTTEPIIALQGQAQHTSLADAVDDALYNNLAFGDLPFQEMKVLYRVIYRTKNTYANTVKSKIAEMTDYRTATLLPGGASPVTDHGSLGGLQDQDHGAGAIFTDTSAFNGALSATEDDVQKALNVLDDDVANNTTHAASDGKDHSDVVLNNTHRTGDGSDHSDVAANTVHSGTVTGNPHVVLATQITDFDTEVSNNTDVAANTSARHSHTNKANLDTINQDMATTDAVAFESIAITQTSVTGLSLSVTRDLAAASTDSPVVKIVQDNSGDDQYALYVQQDGAGVGGWFEQNSDTVWQTVSVNDASQGAATNFINMCIGDNSNRRTALFKRNLGSANTGQPVVEIIQDHTGDDQTTLEIKQDGTGFALDIDMNGDNEAIRITSTATSQNTVDIEKGTNIQPGLRAWVTGGLISSNLARGYNDGVGTNYFYRNLDSTNTSSPVMFIEQDHTGDDQNVLNIQQDGIGHGIKVDHNSSTTGDGITINYIGTGKAIASFGGAAGSYAGHFRKNSDAASIPVVYMEQDHLTGGIPVLELDQDDISEGFINFVGSDRGAIATSTTDSTGSLRIEVAGVVRTIPYFADQ